MAPGAGIRSSRYWSRPATKWWRGTCRRRGDDTTPLNDVSLESWTNALSGHIDQEPEPVVLVGHSRGGLNISQAAERRPDKTKMLVYLCAFLLRNGETVAGMTASTPDSQFGQNIVVADDGASVTLKKELGARGVLWRLLG